ncbi:MAG: hypothetical protein CMO55_25605 [Verrucomicrobiales bacterium]|nr:hypothetical protein [Verrucomicrobiales bacterium]
MNSSRPSFLLVDGNNIIHAWPDLLKLHQRRRGSAHVELIRRLNEYRDYSGQRVVVVFDGRGSTLNEEREPGGLQVIYTSAGNTADDIVERLAIKYAKAYEIVVATDDRAEQDVVVAAGGEVISSLSLRSLLEGSVREMTDWIERNRKRR